MKILFVTDLYPIDEKEVTTPKTLYNFVQSWKKQGHSVDIIRPNFLINSFIRGKKFYKTGKHGDVLNLNFWTPFWFVPSLKTNYDIIIAHMPSGILFADKLGLPFIAGIHNSDLEVLTNPLYKFHFRKRLKKALDNAKGIACRSFVIEKKLLKLFPEFKGKTFVAPSGIDKNIIIKPSISHIFNESPLKILTCANLIKRKNIDKVVEACKNEFKLTVIGDGKEFKKLKKASNNAVFTGRLPHNNVLKLMREHDIFILPSIGETFGLVYLEAMASGCITVCTENDGIDGIIKHKFNGFLVKPNSSDIEKLLLEIKNMNNEQLKLLQHNSLETIEQYTSDNCASEYLQQILKIS